MPGDVAAGAVTFRSGRGEVFAPISPGVRQLVVTYRLAADAFPLVVPLEAPASVVEVLLEEPLATVQGPALVETDAATIDGRVYRRFVARDVAAAGALRVRTPPPTGRTRALMRALLVTLAAAMAAAFVAWHRRRGRAPGAALAPSDVLIAELAALDARFERRGDVSDADRARYAEDRATLKARIARALEAEAPRT
jgi:hypothetical protein